MDELMAKIERTIMNYKLMESGDRILIALSGGPDSIALTHILYFLKTKYNLHLAAAHLDHALRPYSNKDREFCRNLCKRIGIKLYSKRVNVASIAKREKCSIEVAGRKARYNYLEKLSEKYQFGKIATGHTLDDRVETIVFNLARGSGMAGLAGIPFKRGKIIRPFLEVEKSDLLKWIKESKIPYLSDITNKSLIFSRNRIRHKIIPELSRINPAVKQNITRMADLISADLEFITGLSVKAYNGALFRSSKSKIVLDLGKLVEYDKSLRKKVLNEAYKRLTDTTENLSSASLLRALNIIDGESGKIAQLAKGINIEKSIGYVALFKPEIQPGNISLMIPGRTDLVPGETYLEAAVLKLDDNANLKQGGHVANLDFNKMANINIRFWQSGDMIRPLGMHGHRLLSDIFIDCKIPEFERENIPLILSGEEIVWVAGILISDDFKVTDKTHEVLNLKICKQS
jgi:tRNA(Ile)-lysidine synthase